MLNIRLSPCFYLAATLAATLGFGTHALAQSGNFIVMANSPLGSSFTNNNSIPIKIEFYAIGKWGGSSSNNLVQAVRKS
jgi:hypothetical protein